MIKVRVKNVNLLSNLFNLEAILITDENTAELFIPWQNNTCHLPRLPQTERRFNHILSGNMLCGGDHGESRSCLKWNVENGSWVTLPLNLTERRDGSSSAWRVSPGNIVIMGGGGFGDADKTSEIVSIDGDSTRSTFKMKYPTL